MKIAKKFSYRHAEAILEKEYKQGLNEICDVIRAVTWQSKTQSKTRSREGKVVAHLSIDQVRTNELFDHEFKQRGWTVRPRIVSHAESRLVADFKKGVIQVEVQFGNMARWYSDVFKFLLSYAANDIEVGVLIVPLSGAVRRRVEADRKSAAAQEFLNLQMRAHGKDDIYGGFRRL